MLLARCSSRLARTVHKPQKFSSFKLYHRFSTVTPVSLNAPKTDQNLSANNVDPVTQKRLVLSAYKFLRYYQLRGHELCNLDPLKLKNFQQFGKVHAKKPLELDLTSLCQEQDIDIPFRFPQDERIRKRLAGFITNHDEWTLRELHRTLNTIYSTNIGFEYVYINNEKMKYWLMRKFEDLAVKTLNVPAERKLKILRYLNRIQAFNSFLESKLTTSKRFGVEGTDTVISALNALVEEVANADMNGMTLGMAHRGRLSALANVFQKPLERIFAEFQENVQCRIGEWGNSGDVKYHLGVSHDVKINDKNIRLTIVPNPSHLQTVDPVVMGCVRAIQDREKDRSREKTLGVLIHGDAALAGQGIVYQTLQMEKLKQYQIGGVVHIVANNQIGFTTTPAEARTGLYCTDVAKSIQAPIIHVNADQPELVDAAIRVAFEFRQQFKSDIFVDIIGYRRFGHNEQDQPAFTQPMMYQSILAHKRVYDIYSQKLIVQGVITQQQKKEMMKEEIERINSAYTRSRQSDFDSSKWKKTFYYNSLDAGKQDSKNTNITQDEFRSVGLKLLEIPKIWALHPQIVKILDARRQSIEKGEGIDYATAESLALATVLKNGHAIRFSGQDVQRGTFSHRHAIVVDQNTGDKHTFLKNFVKEGDDHLVQLGNSHLSEYAVLGYEYGYSVSNPLALTIWEAQFGDFANGAQAAIDNYITSGESKWQIQSGLVLSLPHGMDGQGPEHSSARPERFLQLMSDNLSTIVQEHKDYVKRPIKNSNIQVVLTSYAANYFHLLRRQVLREYRKPLIHCFSKKLLKYKHAASKLKDFTEQTRFNTVVPETFPEELGLPNQIRKVLIVSGQGYYDLLEYRRINKITDVALVRLQQIAPFPYPFLKEALKQYTNADFYWYQDDHRNYGPWAYVQYRVEFILEELKKEGSIKKAWFGCISRRHSSSPAVGSSKIHQQELAELVKKGFE